MEKLSIYFLKVLVAFSSLVLLSCKQEHWYKKEFTDTEKKTLASQLLEADGKHYYQGTVPEQFMLKEANQLDPNNADVWHELAAAPLKRGLAVEAMYYYGKAQELDPEKWQGWRGYMYLYFYRDYQKAIADFDATDTLTPNFTDYPQGQSVDYMRGLCYYGLEDYTTALRYFNRYIDEVTQDRGEEWVDVYSFLYRGLTYEKFGKPDNAMADFKLGLKYYDKFSDCYYHLSRFYFKQGEFIKAQTSIEKAKDLFKRSYFHSRPYVEVQEQIYIQDIERLEEKIKEKIQE